MHISQYHKKSRIKHQIFTCPKIDNQKNRKNQLVCRTSRMCTATIHIRTSVQLVWNLYRFKPLYHITITLCTAEFETIYPLDLTTKREIEINEIAKHIKYFYTEKVFFSWETKQFILRSYCTTNLSDYKHVYWIIGPVSFKNLNRKYVKI